MPLLTDPVPLRSTAQLEGFESVEVLPLVYGRVKVQPVKYSADGKTWLIADHAIQGVDEVTKSGLPYNAWGFFNGSDSSGHAVALLQTADAVDGELALSVRGAESNGVLITNPADILNHFLIYCGFSVSASRLDNFRVTTNDINLAGVVNGSQSTIRSQIDEIMLSVGAVWSLGMPNVARLWPTAIDSDEAHYLTLSALDIDRFETESDRDDITTAAQVLYGFNYATSEYSQGLSVEALAASEQYGRSEIELAFKWLHEKRNALALARRYLAYSARPAWRSRITISRDDALQTPPGVAITVSHPFAVVSGPQMTVNAAVDILSGTATIETEAAAGDEPVISLISASEGFRPIPFDDSIVVTAESGAASFTVIVNGELQPGAIVEIEGKKYTTGETGIAQITGLSVGTYEATIITADNEKYTTTLVI